MSKLPPEPWHSFLSALDQAVDTQTRLDCIGGFVVTTVYGMERHTGDIDVLDISAGPTTARIREQLLALGGAGSPLHHKLGVYLEQVGIAPLPYEYEERLGEIFAGCYQRLTLMAVDPYDLALSKIERNSLRDRQDVVYLGVHVPFDIDVLRERYQTELRFLLGVPKRDDLTLELWIELIREAKSAAPR
jgi:hypothetical protein